MPQVNEVSWFCMSMIYISLLSLFFFCIFFFSFSSGFYRESFSLNLYSFSLLI